MSPLARAALEPSILLMNTIRQRLHAISLLKSSDLTPFVAGEMAGIFGDRMIVVCLEIHQELRRGAEISTQAHRRLALILRLPLMCR